MRTAIDRGINFMDNSWNYSAMRQLDTSLERLQTSIFDGTAKNPAWLGDAPQRLQSLMP